MAAERQREKNIIAINGAQQIDSKILANKIGDMFAELSFPQNYDHTFP